MISFNRKQLSNGLTLLHHNDPTTPFVVVNILYRVGAKNEDPERTGFAHLFEHLMFEGTSNVPDFDQPLQEAGGINNAFTNNDYTNYYIKLPKENLELALYLEADRMLHLDINDHTLSTQKKVVIEEFKENYTNKPYGDVWHTLRTMVYENHPYRWPTIGKDFHHIADAPLNDVVSFFEKHYHPSNAILCIAGNVSEEDALKFAGSYFESIPNGRAATNDNFEEPEQKASKSLTQEKDVPLDAIYIAFKMPGRLDKEYYHADILSDILAGSKSSRLRERLIKQNHLFVSIDAYITGTVETGMFIIEGKLTESVTPEEAESAIWNEIDNICKEGLEIKELEKVKHKMITYMNFSENNLLSRAIGLCYHEMLGDAGLINREEGIYESVTADDVKNFADQFLNSDQSNTLFYLKANR